LEVLEYSFAHVVTIRSLLVAGHKAAVINVIEIGGRFGTMLTLKRIAGRVEKQVGSIVASSVLKARRPF
jgi:hypothetical protein